MLVAAAVCPCPPLLVPEVASGAAPELEPAREACAGAVHALAAARPDRLVVVAPGRGDTAPTGQDRCTVHPAGTVGSFQRYGVPHRVTLGPDQTRGTGHAHPDGAQADEAQAVGVDLGVSAEPGASLPPALTVGAWLLAAAGWAAAPVTGLAVPPALSPDHCREVGRALAAGDRRTALLVLGDGSACRSRQAPGYLDDRAETFDAAVVNALATADGAALAELDPGLAAELRAEGRAGWQVLAGAAEGATWRGDLGYAQAPYGVGYAVTTWLPVSAAAAA